MIWSGAISHVSWLRASLKDDDDLNLKTYVDPSPALRVFSIADIDESESICKDGPKGSCNQSRHVEDRDSFSDLILTIPAADDEDGTRK